MQVDEHILEEIGLGSRDAPDVIRSLSQITSARLNGYTHAIRRAWKHFDNLAVFCIDGRPTAYVQQCKTEDRLTVREQQTFWSNGVAPLLIRITPTQFQVYTGLRTPALIGEDVDDNGRLIETFERVAQALEIKEFVRSIETGTIYGKHAEHFDPTQAVDQRLVQNLQTTRDLMSAGASPPSLPTIHRFLGRVLFTCYLEARGALVPKDFGGLGAGSSSSFKAIMNLPAAESRKALVRLFGRLARYFRGNLFDDDLGPDLERLRDEDLVTLRELLNGTDLFSGQYVLPFDIYDFSVIPIETVSAVYEDFINAEGEDEQKKKGAFYTPPKLVSFAMNLATEQITNLEGMRVLDPGCGSGVFLVSAFNRKAEAWISSHGEAQNKTRAQALSKILREEICGVDISPIACQATCFSLYMALLDCLDPPEIRSLGPDRLPSLLAKGDQKRRPNGPQTVIEGNFLASLPALEGLQFDLIVGNPPWIARGHVEEEAMAEWNAGHPKKLYPIPAKQVACAFMWTLPSYLDANGVACVLLPAKMILGEQTDQFQKRWFASHRVEKIVHLSDLRFFLFPTVLHPTIAIRFKAGKPEVASKIEFVSPKASEASLFDNVITVEPEDRKQIPLKSLLASASKGEAGVFWLSHNWTTPRDRELLSRIRSLPPLSDLVGELGENKRWIKGQGIQPSGKDAGTTTPFWGPKHLYLDANTKFDFLVTPDNVDPEGGRFKSPHRVRVPEIFKSPIVLFNKGYSKIAYSPFDVLYRDALQGIIGPDADASLLKFLTATLLSPLAGFFLFHMSSRSFYRYPFLSEVLRLPFPLPEDAPGKNAKDAVKAVDVIFSDMSRDERFRSLGHDDLVEECKLRCSQHVLGYFDVNHDEAILIDDTVRFLDPSALRARGSSIPTLKVSLPEDRKLYAITLLDSLKAWGGPDAPRLSARSVIADRSGIAVLTISVSSSSPAYLEETASQSFETVLDRVKKAMPERHGNLVYMRNLAVIESNQIHIVKPLTMRFWLRSAAVNDADATAVHLLRSSGRKT